ncbi:branched-chain amino acid ABC transporter permease [Rhizobium sp. YS-1r]|uniref:branched-chain amino acid ABC transporter permease n=1 Tax=Rhizobium sp. YS-1r TaxID=1532558 RepID=UPI0005100280|nr:branched-chain amino acid ABC transporter permease [Rhizobium sp. YS-1r]KGD94044.1 hydrophobic amino acid ABC transporter permease [Rhizobium sp. YS-1r]
MTIVAQAILNGIMTGMLIAIPALGLTAIFAVLRYVNFAIGAYATVGAFAAWYFNSGLGLGVFPSALVAFVAGGAVGLIAEQTALARLRPSGALAVAIASIAVNLILENVIRFIFGNDLQGFDLPIARDWRFAGLRFGPQQLQTAAIAIAIMAAVFLFLRFTRFGKAMRAVADNPDLGRLFGMDPARIAMITVVLGAGLAGVGGVLLGLDTAIDPMTGSRLLLSIFAAAVLGGLGSIPGAVLGAAMIGIGEELAVLVLPATYRSAVGFATILLILSLRPAGILGERNT